MSGSLATFFVANVPPASPDYDGIQYKFYNFVFRPAQYTTEFYIILAFGTYLTLYLFGKQINKSRARAWFDAHRPILEENFSKPSLATDLIEDGGCDFYMYSTGRVGVKSLHTVFAFQPRHDLLLRLYNLVWSFGDLSYQPCDKIEIDFTLAANTTAPGFVFAIVDKDNIKEFSTNRWDLSFAKTSDNPALSSQYTVFTENADVTDHFLKSAPAAANFVSILKDPEQARYFRSLAVTDMPLDAPEDAPPSLTEQPKHVVLTLAAPPKSDSAATKNLVQAAFALVDYINSREFNVRPDTRTKLLKIRKDMETFLAKQVKEKDVEAAEKKRSEKRKAEEERLAKLSAAEQKKHADSERKRNLRKAQTKGAARIRM